jgi:DNA-binding Lrp family transcriptional regulator
MTLSVMDKMESHDPIAETTLSAFVLINTETNSVRKVSIDLKKIEAVDKIYIVYGVHDIVARVNADSIEHLRNIITMQIRNVDKVKSTLTMTVINP